MKKIYFIFLSLVVLSGCDLVREKSPDEVGVLSDTEGNVTSLAKNDIRFLAAKKIAQREMDYFISALNNYNDSLLYYVKSDFIDSDIHEHMWIDVMEYREGIFYGYLANYPADIKNYQFGDYVNATKDDIEDWMIWDQQTNEYRGYFSREVLEQNR